MTTTKQRPHRRVASAATLEYLAQMLEDAKHERELEPDPEYRMIQVRHFADDGFLHRWRYNALDGIGNLVEGDPVLIDKVHYPHNTVRAVVVALDPHFVQHDGYDGPLSVIRQRWRP